MLTFFPASSEQMIASAAGKTSLRVKFGIDPTRDRLHLGHFVPLRVCRKLQEKGHKLDLVLGTLTAQLGDPSGQDQTRPFISEAETLENAKKILAQIQKVLLPGFTIHHNHRFLDGMSVPGFLSTLVSKFNVAEMLSRDAFRARQAHNQPIALHELLVPLLQGWDSVVLRSEVEIGGTDQLFNFQVTRKLQESQGQIPEVCVMTPIIRGTDGRKMSKTFDNTVWIDEHPKDMFGQIMSIPDDVMKEWMPVFMDDLPDLSLPHHPMSLKKWLAEDIIRQLHNGDIQVSTEARRAFEDIVQKGQAPNEMPLIQAGMTLLDIVIKVREESKTRARTLISQDGVKVNGKTVTDPSLVPVPGDLLKIGKRSFVKVVSG